MNVGSGYGKIIATQPNLDPRSSHVPHIHQDEERPAGRACAALGQDDDLWRVRKSGGRDGAPAADLQARLVDLADEAVVSKRHLELALVTVSLLNKCTYCVSHHAPKLAIQGVSKQGAERLLDYKDHPDLDAVDGLVVEYAIAVTNNWNKNRDEIFARLREHFSEAQIVELTWRIALCGAFNRFNDILQFDIEQGVPVREAAE
jgi:AhpD family alkylhydroperoxidase